MTDSHLVAVLFWIPDFFSRTTAGPEEDRPAVFLIYLVASVGSIGGGWLSAG